MARAENIKKKRKPIMPPEGWKLTPKGTIMKRTFSFSDYLTAFLFVARVSVHAEVLKHHPDIKLSWGKVEVSLTTHSEKTVTKKDVELAERINKFADTAR